ncbi:PA2779 family protein [Desulfurivibrio dismutans]|uniref:PA2779 family protein n=1 Tax=Desulfurivibrio dismutans TaxID=1398908 RepID=UPI0023DA029D|nr:PA2779 family protein [Desulfurivibrio alkaliphilus]MDF1614410.1 PA2779 family protein [Desulfurivibrio alkaliphilus]
MRRFMLSVGKPLCLVLLFSFVLLDLSIHSAQAGMIGTETVIEARAAEVSRERVAEFLERDDVRRALVRQGVAPLEAQKRVAALSDAEVNQIAQELEQLPAGAGIGSIIGAAVFVFLVLLVTDILGFTEVFPFVNPVR